MDFGADCPEYVDQWIKSWLWRTNAKDRGETILGVDQAGESGLIGYITWRFRRMRVRVRETKREVVHIHYMGVDVAHLRQGVASHLFATAERDATSRDRYKPTMPVVIEVEVGNEPARAVCVRWGFEHAGFDVSKTGRTYERMWRPPPER